MMKRTLAAAAAVVAVSLSVTACGSSGGKTAGGAEVVKKGTLTVCSDIPYKPFEMTSKSGGKTTYTGFDMDIVAAIAKGMGLKLAVKSESFDGLESGLTLKSGTCDLVASAMTITDDRKKHLDFTDGYYDSKQSLLVPDGSPVKTLADLAGKKIGVQNGTTGKDYAQAHAPKSAKLVSYDTDPDEFAGIKAGQVDALLQDYPVNLAHQQDGGYKIVESYNTGEKYGFAVKKGNTKLVDELNAQLAKLRKSGEYQTIYNKYFKAS